MTAPARISQADMDRAVRAAAKAERARVIFRLDRAEIEVIIGESPGEDVPGVNPLDRMIFDAP